ncbi:MAG: RNA pyrophosphohydrolase [Rickettsiales bacterium]
MLNLKLYRPAVGILIYKKNYGFWVGKRLNQFQYAWQMPQGGIDAGEKPETAMQRELYEETNISSYKIIDQNDHWLTYDLPQNLAKNFWEGKYVGQKQKWFLLEFTGNDSEININKINPEFSEWSWQNSKFIMANIVKFKYKIYQEIFHKWPDKLTYQQ